MPKKGQGASEYLVLLAIVLIVAIVAIVLVGGFAGLGGGARETESKQYWSGATRPFTIPEYSQQGNTIYLTLKNMEPYKLVITNITITSPYGTIVDSYDNQTISFKGGAKKTITDFGIVNTSYACNTTSYDYYEYGVVITYRTENGIVKSQYGEKPLVGDCIVT
ncbi:MAG: hypothetical protein ABIH83_00090 [Candidatus Micrarchaeota archaeon]